MSETGKQGMKHYRRKSWPMDRGKGALMVGFHHSHHSLNG